jgi:hypothetical protein
MHQDKNRLFVLDHERDLEAANLALAYGATAAPTVFKSIEAPEQYPHTLPEGESRLMLDGMILLTHLRMQGRDIAPILYEQRPIDMEYQNEQIIVKNPEQSIFIANLASLSNVPEDRLVLYRRLHHRSKPMPVDEEVSKAAITTLSLMVRGTYTYDDEELTRCILNGRPITVGDAKRLLNEELHPAGLHIGGYPDNSERRLYLFGKYLEFVKANAAETFEIVGRAEGII